MFIQLFKSLIEAATAYFTWKSEECRLNKERLAYDIEREIEKDIDDLEKSIIDCRNDGRNEFADELRQRQARRYAYLQTSIFDLREGVTNKDN